MMKLLQMRLVANLVQQGVLGSLAVEEVEVEEASEVEEQLGVEEVSEVEEQLLLSFVNSEE